MLKIRLLKAEIALWYCRLRHHAGVAQLVERYLAKVQVDGSSPFTRSKFKTRPGLIRSRVFYVQDERYAAGAGMRRSGVRHFKLAQ